MTNDFDPKDPKITAYALGELNPAEKAEIEKLIHDSDDAQRAVGEIRKTVGLLTEEFQNEVKPSLTEEHRQTIERSLDPRNAVEPVQPGTSRNRSWNRLPLWTTASLLLVVATFVSYQYGLFDRNPGNNRMAVHEENSSLGKRILPNLEMADENSADQKAQGSDAFQLGSSSGKEDAKKDGGLEKKESFDSRSELSQGAQSRGSIAKKGSKSKESGLGRGDFGRGKAFQRKSTQSQNNAGQGVRPVQKPKIEFKKAGKPLPESSTRKSNQPNSNRGRKTMLTEKNRTRRSDPGAFRLRRASHSFYLDPNKLKSLTQRRQLSAQKNDRQKSGKSLSRSQDKKQAENLNTRSRANSISSAKNKSTDPLKKVEDAKHPLGVKFKKKLEQIDDEKSKDKNVKGISAGESLGEVVIMIENNFLPAMPFPNSTYPLIVAIDSYFDVVQYIEKGQLPPPAVVRVEELLNAFEYSIAIPKRNNPLALSIESGKCPWNKDHTLVRIGLQGEKISTATRSKTKSPTVAEDVKLNVQFNPARVGWHRLIGYEHGSLEEEKLVEKKQAAKNAFQVGQSVTALYEVVPPNSSTASGEWLKNKYLDSPKLIDSLKYRNELLSVEVFYSLPGDARVRTITSSHAPQKTVSSSNDFRWAAAVAMYGLWLQNSSYRGKASLLKAQKLAIDAKGKDPTRHRQEFIDLVGKTIRLVEPPAKK